MSSKLVLALAAAGIVAGLAGPSFAKLNGTSVSLACTLPAKEFGVPVEVKNTTNAALPKGKQIMVAIYTLSGVKKETITLTKALPVGGTVRGKNFYQNVSTGCAASVYYPKAI